MSDKPLIYSVNFKKQFEPMILSGEKDITIRVNRADGRDIKPADHLNFYTGLRSSQSKLLGCNKAFIVIPIEIDVKNWRLLYGENYGIFNDAESLAKRDGFKNVDDFFMFFEQTHKSSLVKANLIHWRGDIAIGFKWVRNIRITKVKV